MRHLVVSTRHSRAGVHSGHAQMRNMNHMGCLSIIFLLMGSIRGAEVRCRQDGLVAECADSADPPSEREREKSDKETVEVEVEFSGIEVEVEVEVPVEWKTYVDIGIRDRGYS